MELSLDLLGRMDLAVAIQRAAPAKGEFFPSRLEAEAALFDRDSYVRWVDARLRGSFEPPQAETVWVPRQRPGYRPVPHLPFFERVVYQALVDLLAQELTEDLERLNLRSLTEPDEGERRTFERLPLEEGELQYVGLADVASYYEYVDHERLARDVIEWTADVDLADGICQMLATLVGRQFGIPQGPRPSDLLADLYLSAVDRDQARRGIKAWRYNDDFLIGAGGEEQALLVLRDLETLLRGRGLVLNHEKNRLVDRFTYEEWVDTLAQRLAEATIENVGLTFYGFDPEAFAAFEISDADPRAVEALFVEAMDDSEPDPYRVNARILQQALPVLAKGHSLAPLERLGELATKWRAYSRHVSLYLRELIGTDAEEGMIKAVSGLLEEHEDLPPWVRGWLLDPLARSDQAIPDGLSEMAGKWFFDDDEPWFVRGRSALVQARRGSIPEQQAFNSIFERGSASARADLVAAVRLAEPGWAEEWIRGLDPQEPLLQTIAGWDPGDWSDVL
jgi:Reverse transcriptase (RNA-dependent DNA polymerase)